MGIAGAISGSLIRTSNRAIMFIILAKLTFFYKILFFSYSVMIAQIFVYKAKIYLKLMTICPEHYYIYDVPTYMLKIQRIEICDLYWNSKKFRLNLIVLNSLVHKSAHTDKYLV